MNDEGLPHPLTKWSENRLEAIPRKLDEAESMPPQLNSISRDRGAATRTLEEDLRGMRVDILAQLRRRAAQSHDLLDLRKRNTALATRNAEMGIEAEAAQREVEQLRAEILRLRRKIVFLYNTRSWRATKLLRAVPRWFASRAGS